MSETGSSIVELDTSLQSQTVETMRSPERNPVDLLPVVDNKTELEELSNTVGQSNKNEVQRSNFYRIKPQIDFLRTQLSQLPSDTALNILNIGPAKGEEAIVYTVLAQNASVLNKTTINFVDVVNRDMVNPSFDLGVNFINQPIEPPIVDRSGYVFERGQWQASPEVQKFVTDAMNKPDNSFETPIEEFGRKDDGKRYELVTFNNVAQYLGQGVSKYDNPIYQNEGNFDSFQAVLLSVAERVRNNGILFVQTTGGVSVKEVNPRAIDTYLKQDSNFNEVFETIDPKAGIYKRRSDNPLKMK